MIPSKNFFSGALGKIQNTGGSKFFTTPHTVNVKENYSINVGVNSKCLTCSLDGKLWLFENSVVALKFNNKTKCLEFAASKNIETEKFITRGLDWILTDKSIYLATDDEPYFFSKNLQEDTNAQRVLYSVLRSSVLSEVPRGFTNVTAGSGIDPFTRAAWGMNENNGNTEGWGFFNKNNFLLYPEGSHNMEQCYSLLPPVGDWQIVENFLIRRPDNPLENQSQLAPLIPLEFNGYQLSRSVTYPTYGTGYNLNHRGIQLFIHNGELWARGLMHIGKVYILPAVFHEDGTVKDYYLYISPEYILSPYNQRTTPNMDASNNWLNLAFISSNNVLTGFYSEQNSGLCSVSADGKIFNPDSNEWSSAVSGDNGKLVIDTVNSSTLFLGETGIKFLDSNKQFECNALSQWIAPASQIESVLDDLVISSFDNHTLATCIPTGFNRELLSQRNLHLSAQAIDGKKFSMGFSDGKITVNEVSAINSRIQDSLSWDNIYKNAVNIRLLNVISKNMIHFYVSYIIDTQYPIWLPEIVEDNFDYYYINPDSGELLSKTISIPFSQIPTWKRVQQGDIEYDVEIAGIHPFIELNDIKLEVYYQNGGFQVSDFYAVDSVPSCLLSWNDTANNGITLDSLCYPCVSVDNAISKKLPCCLNAIFNEVATNTKIAYEIPTIGRIDDEGNFYGKSNIQWLFLNYGDSSTYKKDYRNRNRSKSNLHLIVDSNSNWYSLGNILIFRSELNSDVFDFDNELLRSVVS